MVSSSSWPVNRWEQLSARVTLELSGYMADHP
jgi:hypothetical protein